MMSFAHILCPRSRTIRKEEVMKKRIVVTLCLMICMLGACGSKHINTEQNTTDISSSISEEDDDTDQELNQEDNISLKDYQQYNGYWSVDGISHDKIIEQGGAELYCSVTENNLFEGMMYTQQGTTERIAEIDNISGEIQNNELLFEFSDDGFGNSGTLHIVFLENTISVEVIDFKMDEENSTGYGISGNYSFIKMIDAEKNEQSVDMSSLTEEELMAEVNSRSQYYKASKYYEQVMDYWENERETRDIVNILEPLFSTDTVVYTKENLLDEPDFIIHLGKNEIYARHGYIFKDEDLNNYFRGCAWYNPITTAEQFDDTVFNEVEQENLKLFSEMDTFE